MSTPTVSVIIPTYNRRDLLPATIDSVLNQTFTDFELLICDDGSTDDTEAIIRNISDPRVRWLPGPHCGCPAIPRNRGLRESRGTWIAMLDSDDTWQKDKLEVQLQVLQGSPNLAVASNGWAFNPSASKPERMSEWAADTFSFKDMMKVNRVITSSVMFHQSLIDKIGMFPESSNLVSKEDYAFWLRIATFTDFAYLKAEQVNYLDLPSQSLRSKNRHKTFPALQNVVLNDYLDWSKAYGYNGPLTSIARKKIYLNFYFGWLVESVASLREFVRKIRRSICRKS